MKYYSIFLTVFLLVQTTWGYLGENFSPFTVSIQQQEPLIFKPGDTVHITWNITPGVRFPIYGYASSRTAKTDVGLLLPDASRTDDYIHLIDTGLSLTDTQQQYNWTIQENIPSGKYRIGIGFFYREISAEFIIVARHQEEKVFLLQQ